MTPLTRQALERVLGFTVVDFSKYYPVFTHISASKLDHESYERSEFMGDAVINFVVAKLLFDMFPTANEGFLTKIRTKLVSGDCLSHLGYQLGLHNFITMNDRSMQQGFHKNRRILEDVFEALVGAVYLDRGASVAKTFFLNVLNRYVNFQDVLRDTNYKDGIMRYAQARGMPLPEYVVVSTSPIAAKAFAVHVGLNGLVGQGVGPSKKHAEQQAAKHLLFLVGGLTPEGDVAAVSKPSSLGSGEVVMPAVRPTSREVRRRRPIHAQNVLSCQ